MTGGQPRLESSEVPDAKQSVGGHKAESEDAADADELDDDDVDDWGEDL